MSYFDQQPVKRVTLPSDANYWVDVATDFRYGQVKQFAVANSDNLDFATSADKFLLMAIKEWNLDDADGTIKEINAENIDLLKQDDVTAIINAANAEVVTDNDTKKNS